MGEILLQGRRLSIIPTLLFRTFKPILQVHLIEKQEAKRQVLKKRAEQTKVDSDSEINWDEDDDDLENVQDIPGEGYNGFDKK